MKKIKFTGTNEDLKIILCGNKFCLYIGQAVKIYILGSNI